MLRGFSLHFSCGFFPLVFFIDPGLAHWGLTDSVSPASSPQPHSGIILFTLSAHGAGPSAEPSWGLSLCLSLPAVLLPPGLRALPPLTIAAVSTLGIYKRPSYKAHSSKRPIFGTRRNSYLDIFFSPEPTKRPCLLLEVLPTPLPHVAAEPVVPLGLGCVALQRLPRH